MSNRIHIRFMDRELQESPEAVEWLKRCEDRLNAFMDAHIQNIQERMTATEVIARYNQRMKS